MCHRRSLLRGRPADHLRWGDPGRLLSKRGNLDELRNRFGPCRLFRRRCCIDRRAASDQPDWRMRGRGPVTGAGMRKGHALQVTDTGHRSFGRHANGGGARLGPGPLGVGQGRFGRAQKKAGSMSRPSPFSTSFGPGLELRPAFAARPLSHPTDQQTVGRLSLPQFELRGDHNHCLIEWRDTARGSWVLVTAGRWLLRVKPHHLFPPRATIGGRSTADREGFVTACQVGRVLTSTIESTDSAVPSPPCRVRPLPRPILPLSGRVVLLLASPSLAQDSNGSNPFALIVSVQRYLGPADGGKRWTPAGRGNFTSSSNR